MPADDPSPATPAAPPMGEDGDSPLHLGYVVRIDNFSGPLDLLLFLVRRTELDIIDIPILLIVDQFVEAVGQWQDPDLETAGDFILMAATLLEIKARAIAPPRDGDEPVGADDEIFDPRSTLISSLLRYRRFKEAARLLELLGEARAPCLERQLHEVVPEEAPDESDLDLSAVDVHLLLRTCEAIFLRLNGLGPRTVLVDDIPMGVRIERLIDALRERSPVSLGLLLGQSPSRLTQVAMVLAVLEGTRQGLVAIGQERQYGEIALRLREADEAVAGEAPAAEEEEPKRRRRLPLVTYQAPDAADEGAEAPLEEEVESDEQRFLRELEEASQVDALLAGVSDLDAAFAAYCAVHHPELLARSAVDEAPGATVGIAADASDAAAGATTPSAVPAAIASPAVPASADPTPGQGPVLAGNEQQPVAEGPAAPGAAPMPGPAADVSPASHHDAAGAARPDAVPPGASSLACAHEGAVAGVDPDGHPGSGPHSDQAVAGQGAEAPPSVAATASPPEPAHDHQDGQGARAEGSADALAGTAVSDALPLQGPCASDVAQAVPPPVDDEPGAAITAWAGPPAAASTELLAAGIPLSVPEHAVIALEEGAVAGQEARSGDAGIPPAIRGEPPSSEPMRADPAMIRAGSPAAIASQDEHALAMAAISARPHAPPLAPPIPFAEAKDEPAVASDVQSVALPAAAHSEPTSAARADAIPPPTAAAIAAVAEVTVEAPRSADRPAVTAPANDPPAAAAAATPGEDATAVAAAAELQPARAEAQALIQMPAQPAHAIHSAPLVAADTTAVTTGAALQAMATSAVHAASEQPAAQPADPPPAAASIDLPPTVPQPRGREADAREPHHGRADDPAPEDELPLRLPGREPEPPGGPPPRSYRFPSRRASATSPTPTLAKAPSAMPHPPQRRMLIIAALVAMNCAWLAYTWLSWVPRDQLEVVAAPPAQVEGRVPLRFAFNLDMVGAAALGRPPAATPEIIPAIAGSWFWRDARTLEFAPRDDLPAASVFNILLATEALRAESGLRLGHDVRLAIHTASLTMQGARLETFAPGGRSTIVLDFNQAVDPALIARALSIADAADAPAQVATEAPRVSALDAAPSARVRLQVDSGGRFELAAAVLSLPGGTCGIAGPLGLALPWQARLDLGHVLAVRTLSVDAPSRGGIAVHLTTSAHGVPVGVLASALSVQPPVTFAVHATGQGLDLVGDFHAGESYRIAVDERWPEASPLHPLAAYPAGGSWLVAIPARQPGLWLEDATAADGRLMLGAQAVEQASVEVLPMGEEQALVTSAVAFQASGDNGRWDATLDGDQLFAALPSGRYRLRVHAGDEPQAMAETELTIEEIPLRPRDLAAAVARWYAQGITGSSGSDVAIRRLRFAR